MRRIARRLWCRLFGHRKPCRGVLGPNGVEWWECRRCGTRSPSGLGGGYYGEGT